MKNLIFILLAIFSFTAILSCEETNDSSYENGVVELFLLESYENNGLYGKINESTVVLESEPIIHYSDIISYNKTRYAFEITEKSRQTILELDVPIDGSAFAVTVNKDVIYTGYFWPSYSSAICNWTVIDPFLVDTDNKLYVKLGYPDQLVDEPIPDRRNDQRILEVFSQDHKLVQ